MKISCTKQDIATLILTQNLFTRAISFLFFFVREVLFYYQIKRYPSVFFQKSLGVQRDKHSSKHFLKSGNHDKLLGTEKRNINIVYSNKHFLKKSWKRSTVEVTALRVFSSLTTWLGDLAESKGDDQVLVNCENISVKLHNIMQK